MKKIAPHINRQRLLVEGFYSKDVDEEKIREYFKHITSKLNLKMYGEPIIFSPQGAGKEINEGYDAFVPLIDSGISLYVWTNEKFLSVVIYTCKSFDEEISIEETKNFFDCSEIVHHSF